MRYIMVGYPLLDNNRRVLCRCISGLARLTSKLTPIMHPLPFVLRNSLYDGTPYWYPGHPCRGPLHLQGLLGHRGAAQRRPAAAGDHRPDGQGGVARQRHLHRPRGHRRVRIRALPAGGPGWWPWHADHGAVRLRRLHEPHRGQHHFGEAREQATRRHQVPLHPAGGRLPGRLRHVAGGELRHRSGRALDGHPVPADGQHGDLPWRRGGGVRLAGRHHSGPHLGGTW